MTSYKSTSGKASGVIKYSTGDDYIETTFVNHITYKYRELENGSAVIDKMKKLAFDQLGLSTYIAQNNPVYCEKY